MKRKFFIRRFLRYLLLLMIPTVMIFSFAMISYNYQLDKSLDARAQNTLSNVNNSLEMMVSNVAYQNEQLTNNAYTLIALKRLMQRETKIPYSDAIYLRNIKATLSSIIRAYPYIQSVYLYLDGYSNYFSSDYGLVQLEPKEKNNWYSSYRAMGEEEESLMEIRAAKDTGYGRSMLTIYQKMKLQKGVVVMNIDAGDYLASLDEILQKDNETVLYLDKKDQLLLSWNDENGAAEGFNSAEYRNKGQQNYWKRINGKSYLVHTAVNEQYDLFLVSLISAQAKMNGILQVAGAFFAVFLLNIIVMMALAYTTTVRTFRQIEYMIQVFYDAESGIYPSGPRQEVKDEYDILMNNIIYLFLNKVKLQTELTEKRHNQEVAELTALQLQINPHFLFNTLQTLQFQIQSKASSEESVTILEYLSDILKYALAEATEMISLREELLYLKKYVAIQKFRFGEKFIIYYEVDEELMDLKVFRLMLQPLVENSILHGVRYKEGRGYIKVQILRRKGKVYFRVIDNGVGMDKEEKERLRDSMKEINVHHIGLANVNSRLKLHFGDGSGIRIRSKKGMGCVMEFCFPENMGCEEQGANEE